MSDIINLLLKNRTVDKVKLSVRFQIKPGQTIVLGFLGMIFLGSLLLSLPIATVSRHSLPYVDALFTSFSAVCVTGLAVVETGTTYSMFGQIVILCLIQMGGLGFMSVATLVYMVMGKRIRLKERMALQESLNQFELSGVVRTTRSILFITMFAELTGAVLLSTRFIPIFGIQKGIYYSIFHSISAFCNAGFDILGTGNSFAQFVGDPVVVITLCLLIVVGGIGFFVILDIVHMIRNGNARLSTHSKIAILTTIILIVVAFAFFTLVEWNNPGTLGKKGMTAGDKLLAGLFQAVTPRTAGYSTINQAALTAPSKMITIILMFIGASPAGTGGGIKTTTFIVVLLMLFTTMNGKGNVTSFKKRIDKQTVARATAIAMLSAIFVVLVTVMMYFFEMDRGITGKLLFESVSAFGTVGLSQNLTPLLSVGSKITLMVAMFAGRVGLLTLTLSIARQLANPNSKMRYPEDKVIIG